MSEEPASRHCKYSYEKRTITMKLIFISIPISILYQN